MQVWKRRVQKCQVMETRQYIDLLLRHCSQYGWIIIKSSDNVKFKYVKEEVRNIKLEVRNIKFTSNNRVESFHASSGDVYTISNFGANAPCKNKEKTPCRNGGWTDFDVLSNK